jgi:hypothetical protein
VKELSRICVLLQKKEKASFRTDETRTGQGKFWIHKKSDQLPKHCKFRDNDDLLYLKLSMGVVDGGSGRGPYQNEI